MVPNPASVRVQRGPGGAPHPMPGHIPGPTHGDSKRDSGKVSLIVNVYGAKDPHATAKAVDNVLRKHFGNPRSMIASGGPSRTHPLLPKALTVGAD